MHPGQRHDPNRTLSPASIGRLFGASPAPALCLCKPVLAGLGLLLPMKLTLQGQLETEVYASGVGYVCIKQTNPLGDEDSLVLIRPEDVDLLTQYLTIAQKYAFKYRSEYIAENSSEEEAHDA